MAKRPRRNLPREGDRFNPYNEFHGVFIPDPVFYFPGLKPSVKLCYARLLRYNGKNNTCYPKVGTLARELGVSERQVQKYLDVLSQKGFIRRIAPTDQRGRRLPNDIEFLAHKVFINAPVNQRKG